MSESLPPDAELERLSRNFVFLRKSPHKGGPYRCVLIPSDTPSIDYLKWRTVINEHGCWVWQGKPSNSGYGQASWRGKTTTAHRAAYQYMKGDLPPDIEVCHNCPGGDNPLCINPDHLFIGTHAVNMADASRKGWYRKDRTRRAANKSAKLDADKVREIRRRAMAGENLTSIARSFCVYPNAVRLIIAGQTWKHVA